MKKRTFVLWRKVLIRVAICLAIFGIFFLYFQTSAFTIKNYDIQGVDEIYKQVLINRFRELEPEKILKILPGNSIFSYHRRAMSRIVHDTLPNTASLSIFPPSLHTIRVVVTPYKPMFRKSERQAITSTGVVYKEIHDISRLPTLESASSSFITSELLSSMSNLYPKITATLFPVASVYVDENKDIHLRGGQHMSEVIVDGNGDIDKAWSNLLSAIDTEPLKSKLATNKNALQYLDTRFGNKVFYRFTNEEVKSIIDHDNNNNAISTATTTTH